MQYMKDHNPLEAPRASSPGPANHIIAIAVIAIASFVVGLLLTPGDSISMLFGVVLVFPVVLTAYLVGFRNGKIG